MKKQNKNASRLSKIGLPPGTPVYLGRERTDEISLEVFQYSDAEVRHKDHVQPGNLRQYVSEGNVTWINIDGMYDQQLVRDVGDEFGLHPLTQEDIMNTDHRPKVEYFEEYVHFTLKMLSFNHDKKSIDSEQVSFVLGKQFVISFQERPGDIFNPIRDRLRGNRGRICKRGADYLVYALIDVIVDNYFIITDALQVEIEALEHRIIEGGEEEDLQTLLKLKKDMAFMRKSVIPVREAVSALNKSDSDLIEKHTRQYLRDVYDHTIHISDSIENHREMLQSLLDIYLTGLSNKLNNVMKTLTVISTVFIPLTFIAGLWGMNFRVVPMGNDDNGFWWITFIMVGIAGIMVVWLRRKKWF